MAQGSRPERIGDQIRVELADLLARQVKDPRIGFITLTHVQVTADLSLARVYFTSLGDEAVRHAAKRGLDRAAPFLRRQIGRRLRLKRVPALRFLFDDSIARQDRVEQLLQEIHEDESAREDHAGHEDRESNED